MKKYLRLWQLIALFVGLGLGMVILGGSTAAQEAVPAPSIVGTIYDLQGQPVAGAQVRLSQTAESEPLAQAATQPDGHFTLAITEPIPDAPLLFVERDHFHDIQRELTADQVQCLRQGQSVTLSEIVLERRISLAFGIATAIFVIILVLIALGKLHNTLAALLGAAIVLAISYLGRPLHPDLFIFDFEGALRYIDWNVIFLVMGMMIFIAVVERTGLFQWLALMAYRVAGGRLWLLLAVLMIVAGVASAFLDNVTTMLLMTPITIQIALAMGTNPLALLIPEVLASNVVGISTLIGTPTNILIGSYAQLSFNDFLSNLTPGVLLALVGLVIYSELIYRREFKGSGPGQVSELLMAKLTERARITEPVNLRKAGVVGVGMLALFIFGENFHLLPAVTALLGSSILLVWIRPDIEEMIEAVDWTTLVFFMSLFIIVGAIQEVGLISFIAQGIGSLVGGNLTLAMVVVIWASALLSMIIANIPFTAAMLPVVAYLTRTIPGVETKALFYCLSVGSAMGGNGSLIGASANLISAGIAERAGYPITYLYFLKKGFPAMLITLTLATLWLLLRFLVLGG